MEDEDVKTINTPYFEIEYLDDNNTKHLGKVQDSNELAYMRERFTVLCKALTYDKYSEIQENCIDITTKEPTFDLQKLQIELVFNGVFNAQDGTRFFSNKELHKKFKVPHGKELIKKLLLSGEISALADTITELTGFKGDLIEEVKN